MSAGLNRERWWRVLSQMRRRGPWRFHLSDPVAPRARGSPQFAAGERGCRGAGSYPRPFGILGLVPYINGGYGHLGEAQFFSQYNLPEVGIYLGILPVVALITLLYPRWPSRIPPRDRLTWYVVGLFGLLLALGLEHAA